MNNHVHGIGCCILESIAKREGDLHIDPDAYILDDYVPDRDGYMSSDDDHYGINYRDITTDVSLPSYEVTIITLMNYIENTFILTLHGDIIDVFQDPGVDHVPPDIICSFEVADPDCGWKIWDFMLNNLTDDYDDSWDDD